MATKPDLEKFLTDPAFEEDRKFFFGMFDKFFDAKMQAEAEKKKAQEPDNIFDKWFGGGNQ